MGKIFVLIFCGCVIANGIFLLILVFKNGEIVERGTEAQLLELNGEYRELYEYQIRPHEEALKQLNINSLSEAGL